MEGVVAVAVVDHGQSKITHCVGCDNFFDISVTCYDYCDYHKFTYCEYCLKKARCNDSECPALPSGSTADVVICDHCMRTFCLEHAEVDKVPAGYYFCRYCVAMEGVGRPMPPRPGDRDSLISHIGYLAYRVHFQLPDSIKKLEKGAFQYDESKVHEFKEAIAKNGVITPDLLDNWNNFSRSQEVDPRLETCRKELETFRDELNSMYLVLCGKDIEACAVDQHPAPIVVEGLNISGLNDRNNKQVHEDREPDYEEGKGKRSRKQK